MIVLLTGASGFLGQVLLQELTAAGHSVVAFSRQPRPQQDRVTWVVADLTAHQALFAAQVIASVRLVQVVIHAAGLYDLTAPGDELYLHNVIATSNLLQLARYMPHLEHFSQISTVAIAGDYRGVFYEAMDDVGQSFADPYAASKFAAEHLVRTAEFFPSRSILRLGVLVGDSRTGWTTKVDGPYYMQGLLSKVAKHAPRFRRLRYLPVPFSETSQLMVVPVDITAQAIVQLLPVVVGQQECRTYHVMDQASQVSIRRILTALCDHYDIRLEPLPLPKWALPASVASKFGLPPQILPYMHLPWTFASSLLASELPGFKCPRFNDYAERLFTAADRQHFGQPGGQP